MQMAQLTSPVRRRIAINLAPALAMDIGQSSAVSDHATRKDVKRTCELHDPKPRWTDRCPLPVLGLSLWLFFGALAMLIVPFAFRLVFPLFGILLVGWLGVIVSIVFAAVWLYAAWALYRLDRRGWWVFL